uniref:NTR domain-containing protein n=1 Tax=Steinernema glaseri TaxID=37863 RepID=A0A1I7YHS7_9BILA
MVSKTTCRMLTWTLFRPTDDYKDSDRSSRQEIDISFCCLKSTDPQALTLYNKIYFAQIVDLKEHVDESKYQLTITKTLVIPNVVDRVREEYCFSYAPVTVCPSGTTEDWSSRHDIDISFCCLPYADPQTLALYKKIYVAQIVDLKEHVDESTCRFHRARGVMAFSRCVPN